MNNLKQIIYIFLFTLFGAMLGFFLHMVLEILYINIFLLGNFKIVNFSLKWQNIILVHTIFTTSLVFVLGILGFYQGKYWWRKLYINGKYK